MASDDGFWRDDFLKIVFLMLVFVASIHLVFADSENSSIVLNSDNESDDSYVEPTIDISVSETDLEVDEEFETEISIDSGSEDIVKIVIDFGDGDQISRNFDNPLSGAYVQYEDHSYSDEGDYKITVIVDYDSGGGKTGSSSTIEVEETEEPDDEPEVDLIYPTSGAQIKSSSITFRFEVSDDNELDSCEFKIYVRDGTSETLNYSTDIDEPEIDEEYSVTLNEFEDENYTWKIICTDNASQDATESLKFEVKTQAHEREKEIKALIDELEEFTSTKGSLSLEEQDAIEDVGVLDDLVYYEERLDEINKGLTQKSTDEGLIAEFEEIKSKIPTSIEIYSSEEYVKNSFSSPFEEIFGKYLDVRVSELGNIKRKILTQRNEEIQGKMSISSIVEKLRVSSKQGNEEYTIVRKTIQTSLEGIKIIEVVPQGKINLLSKLVNIDSEMYEAPLEDLVDGEISYYFESDVSKSEIEKSETFFYQEFELGGLEIVGFAVFDLGLSGKSTYAVLIVLVLVGVLFFVKKKKRIKIGHELKEIKKISKEGILMARKNNVSGAKDKYLKIREAYRLLDSDSKKVVYPGLKNLRMEIDKKEMRDFIKDFKETKKRGDVEAAKKMYEKIKEKYTRLPKKYQKKVYEKIISSGP